MMKLIHRWSKKRTSLALKLKLYMFIYCFNGLSYTHAAQLSLTGHSFPPQLLTCCECIREHIQLQQYIHCSHMYNLLHKCLNCQNVRNSQSMFISPLSSDSMICTEHEIFLMSHFAWRCWAEVTACGGKRCVCFFVWRLTFILLTLTRGSVSPCFLSLFGAASERDSVLIMTVYRCDLFLGSQKTHLQEKTPPWFVPSSLPSSSPFVILRAPHRRSRSLQRAQRKFQPLFSKRGYKKSLHHFRFPTL